MDVNNTTQDNSTFENVSYFGFNGYSNSSFDFIINNNAFSKTGFITDVVTYIIISISLPLTFVAIYSLYSMVQNGHVAPIYVINLLISDLIQLCCMICEQTRPKSPMINSINDNIHRYSLMTSVGFMLCIALERYLLIVFPLWYHCRRTIKSTVVICVVAWAIPALYFFIFYFGVNDALIIFIVILLLPFPLLIFFCCATLKVLSASVSILPEEKRRIVGTLVLVLLIYMLLFFPRIIWMIVRKYVKDKSLTYTLFYLSIVSIKLNPLADLVLYIFMKKGALDKILAFVRCCRVEDQDVSSLVNNTNSEN